MVELGFILEIVQNTKQLEIGLDYIICNYSMVRLARRKFARK